MSEKMIGQTLLVLGLTLLAISLASILAGCGDSNEHAVFRSGDMITIYWVLEENEEINNFELRNNILEFDIDAGELREKQMLPINFAKSHETLEIKGMSRLDDLTIFHILVNPMKQSHSELPKTQSTYMTYRGRKQSINLDEKPGDFTHAKAFRSGDRITVYWHRSEKSEKTKFKWTRGHSRSDMWMEGRGLPDNWTELLSIKEVEPHENIKLIGLGSTPEIFIAYFRVFPNPAK